MIEISSTQSSVQAKKIIQKRSLANVSLARWSLPLILAFQAFLSWILLQNTAFQDEALYVYAGRQILQHWFIGQPLFDRYSFYFSGNPYVYPIIGGALDMVGGLELARSFSLLCMLITTTCGYYVTIRLFNKKSAVFAALFFICQGPVLFLSRLATYDPLCLCLLAIAMALAVKASLARRPWWSLSIGPFIVLAFGAKYAALLFIPSILAVFALSTLLKKGWISFLVRGIVAMVSLGACAAAAVYVVLHFDRDMLHALGATTTNRVVIEVYPRLGLTEHVLQMVGLSYAIGLIALFFMRKKQALIVLLFFGSALLVPAYHIYKAELISLDKHLAFSMFFLMPVAGFALASLSGFRRPFSSGRYWLAGVAICLVVLLIGAKEAQDMYSTWPPTTSLAYALNTQVRTGSGYYLAEQFEVSRYNLRKDTYTWQWTGLDFFQYTDKQGNYYLGKEAYVKAVEAGYFSIIQLNYGYNVATAILIAKAIDQSKKYVLIAKIPYHNFYGNGYFWIWSKR